MWDWLFQLIDPFEEKSIPYAIVGSIASSVYGEPRATNDLDLVVQLSLRDAERLVSALPVKQFYVPPVEVVMAELARSHGGHMSVIALESDGEARFVPAACDAGRLVWSASLARNRGPGLLVCRT